MKKNRIVAYLRIILCAYASTSIMGITPPPIDFYKSIKTPQWIKDPTQQAYVQTLLNRMPQRLSVFARKNPYTTALIAAILSSGGIYGGYAGLKWVWKSPRKAPTPPQPGEPAPVVEPQPVPEPAYEAELAEIRRIEFKETWQNRKEDTRRVTAELVNQRDAKKANIPGEQKQQVDMAFQEVTDAQVELFRLIQSSQQTPREELNQKYNEIAKANNNFVRAKEKFIDLLNSIPDAAPAK